jgi:hypothetical protein
MRKILSRLNGWWLIIGSGFIGLVVIIASAQWARLSDDLWLEIAKAVIQVVAVGVLGGALAAAWRNITAKREARARAEAKISDELVSLVTLYNDVKCVRRTIRSLGLDLKTYECSEGGTLTAEQAQGFHTQMLILNRLQLGFEAKAKQFGQTDLLGEATAEVVVKLGQIEHHLNGVLTLWEKSGWTIRAGTRIDLVYKGLKPLLRIRDHLRPNVSDPMRRITELVNQQVFGKASKDARTALNDVLLKHDRRDS